jgi:hypothetical protein
VASRSELSTPFITKLEKPETGGAGADREPFPPSTENNGTRFSNRRARRGSQQVHSRASKRDETNMSLTDLIGGEPGNLGGLMQIFFPPLNPMEPNNRKLPGGNDRWSFAGGSRSGQLVCDRWSFGGGSQRLSVSVSVGEYQSDSDACSNRNYRG